MKKLFTPKNLLILLLLGIILYLMFFKPSDANFDNKKYQVVKTEIDTFYKDTGYVIDEFDTIGNARQFVYSGKNVENPDKTFEGIFFP